VFPGHSDTPDKSVDDPCTQIYDVFVHPGLESVIAHLIEAARKLPG